MGKEDGKFMKWLIDKGIVGEDDGSNNPGEWRQFTAQDLQAKRDADALARLTAVEPKPAEKPKDETKY